MLSFHYKIKHKALENLNIVSAGKAKFPVQQ